MHFEIRLAVKVGSSGLVRTALLAFSAFLVMATLMAGLVAADGISTTRAELVAQSYANGNISVSLTVSDRKEVERAAAKVPADVATLLSVQLDVQEPPIPIRKGTSTTVSNYRELDWARVPPLDRYRFTDGVLPRTASEVALSYPVARSLGAKVGDQVQLAFGASSYSVVGVFVDRTAHESGEILAGPGTWWTLTQSQVGGLPVGVALMFARGADPDAVAAALGDDFGFVQPVLDSEPLPFYLAQLLLVAVPVGIAIGVAFGALILVRFQRTASDLAVASALGLAAPELRLVMLVAYGTVMVPAIVAGALAGVPMGNMLAPTVAELAGRDVAIRGFPWSGLGVLAGGALMACGLVAWFAAGRMVVALHGGAAARPKNDEVSPTGRISVGWLITSLVGLILLGYRWVSSDSELTGSLAVGLGANLVLAGLSGVVLGLIAFVSTGVASSVRVATQLTGRDRGRSMGVAAAVMVGLFLPVSVATDNTTRYEATVQAYAPSFPPGQVRIRTIGEPLPPAAIARLTEVAGSAVLERTVLLTSTADGSEGRHWTLVVQDPDAPIDVFAVNKVEDIELLTGYQPSTADTAALQQGSVLSLSGRPTAQELTAPSDGQPKVMSVVVVAATGPVSGAAAATLPAVVLTPRFAGTQPWTAGVFDYRVPNAADRLLLLQAAGVEFGITPSAFLIDAPRPGEPNIRGQLSIVVGTLIAVALAAMLTLGLIRERERDLRQLRMLGSSRTSVAVTGGLLGAIPVAVGVIAGVVGGIGVAMVNLRHVEAPLIVPWASLALGGVALCATAAVLGAWSGWFASRLRPNE